MGGSGVGVEIPFGVHTPYGILVTILKDDSTISYRLLKADGTVKDIPLENISS